MSISVRIGMGATIHIGREIQCLPYAGFVTPSSSRTDMEKQQIRQGSIWLFFLAEFILTVQILRAKISAQFLSSSISDQNCHAEGATVLPPLQAMPDSRSLSPFLCHTYVIHSPKNTIMRLENIYVKYTIAFPWIEQQQIVCVLRILPLIVTVNNVTRLNVT